MSCSNCYNGCTEIVSDKCVRYTGIDVPVLGIQTGDSLSYVEQALIEFLTSTLDGTGIKLTIDPDIICTLVNTYLPDCEDLNALNLFKALIQATCDLQTQVDAIVLDLVNLESNYDVDCLPGVSVSSGTHDILQATITKLCDVNAELTALAVDVDTNYVKLSDLNTLIQAYLDSIAPIAQQYVKMVPYTVVEYYGPLSNFDAGGKGLVGLGWDKIYICNGQPGTPDKRGRIGIGATTGVPGGAMDPIVNPGSGNFSYTLNSINGVNNVTLSSGQMPIHTHTTTPLPVDHTHLMFGSTVQTNAASTLNAVDQVAFARTVSAQDVNYQAMADTTPASLGKSGVASVTANVTVNSAGGGFSHTNVPPVWATNYIMYIP
jgi:microcystin-dependent protein